jgi:hypothetical protein
MTYYLAFGKDTSMDGGYWHVVIRAESKPLAQAALRNHLSRIKREELYPPTDIERIEPSDDFVIYSDVE